MVEINNYKNWHNYDCFDIKTDEGEFSIHFENNLDLYWTYLYKKNFLDTKDSYDISITKENYFLYSLFDELYKNVSDGNVVIDDYVINILKSDRDYLIKNNSILYLSDDFCDGEASSFEIKKVDDDSYNLRFNKSNSKDYFNTFSVRIRNSGSRYNYLSILFMNMYRKLIEYSKEEYYQMHIEEIAYVRKKVK